MNDRAIHELPVPILTDEELLKEYDHTFSAALEVNSPQNGSMVHADSVLRRNSATMGELLRRGYRSAGLDWHRSEDS